MRTDRNVTRITPALLRRVVWPHLIPLVLLVVAVAGLFLTSPYNQDFWNSDAPRHAMDGAFYLDFFRDLPLNRLREYATDYYLQYPSLTILFYPPALPIVEAAFFGILGVSVFAAQLTIAFFYLLAAWGAYALCRRWLNTWAAFSVSLLFIAFPEVALWGRQVMLEIPACALLIWSSYALFRYFDRWQPGFLYLAVTLLAAGAYTKQTVLFIVPAFVLMLFAQRRRKLYLDVRVWAALTLMAIELVPLAILTWEAGRFNLKSVAGGQYTQGAPSVFSWHSWTFYAHEFPAEIGWAPLLLACVYVAAKLWRKEWRKPANMFMMAWLGFGYIFFSLIALKEPRHAVLILFPLAFFAVGGLSRLLPAKGAHWVAVGLATINLACTLVWRPVPYVSGYRRVVNYLAADAPHDSVILFSGSRDGAFVFDLRARRDRPDLSVLRADKLLEDVTVAREYGIAEKDFSEPEIAGMLGRYAVSYVVSQPNFWSDLQEMQRLQHVLHSSQFKLLARFPITGNVYHVDQEIEVYRNLGPVNPKREQIRLNLPIVGVTIQGDIGGRSRR